MKRLNWLNISLFIITILIVLLYVFAMQQNNSRKIKKIEVNFLDNENTFLTHEMVNNLLKQNLTPFNDIEKDEVVLKTLESVLNKHNSIEKAEVYTNVEGVLNAVVIQKKPVARVQTNTKQYYISNTGKTMPLSSHFTARVPLIFTDISQNKLEKYMPLLNYINDNEFLKKNITGLEIKPSGDVELTARIYNYKILVGKPQNIENKLKNYEAFYHYAIKDTLINHYKRVNIMFSNQVVCSK